MKHMIAEVDAYLQEAADWREELFLLRSIALECGLTEEFKWKQPCYTHDGANVVILARLKECCTLGFFKGALLKDPDGILDKPGEHTQSARVVRFTSVEAVNQWRAALVSCIAEAIDNERQGRKVEFKKTSEFDTPDELRAEFDVDPAFKHAWDQLTPGRQRGYLLQFSSAKQSATRTTRIQKAMPRILAGKGLQDCICGHSQKMPRCDGSHQYH